MAALDRRAVVARLLRDRTDLLVVSGLGAPSYDVAAAGDHPRNFCLWGAMGGAAVMGLGLALAQPDVPVAVITGDGETLMGLGAFATIALQAPKKSDRRRARQRALRRDRRTGDAHRRANRPRSGGAGLRHCRCAHNFGRRRPHNAGEPFSRDRRWPLRRGGQDFARKPAASPAAARRRPHEAADT